MAVKASASVTLSSVVDVKSVWRYYKLQSSTLSKPAKPTTNPPSGWTTTEPSYTNGSTNSLYFCDLTIFSNNTFTYSDVSLSSSYEAAKAAWNKAQGAQDSVDNMEIGGRNLFSWHGTGEEDIRLNDYQNTGSFTQFYECLTFDAAETVGETYTVSFWAKSPNGTTPLRVYNMNGEPRYFWFNQTLDTALGNAWKHYSYTFKNTDMAPSHTAKYNRIEIYAPDKMGVLVKKIKIEKGNKATDWTPAPEDVKADVDNAQSSADNANTSADNAIKNIQHLNTELTKHESAVESRFTNMVEYVDGKTEVVDTWIRSGSDGTTPFCELGQSNSNFKARLTNTELGFYEQTDKIAYFGNKQMHVTDADIDTANVDKLTIGGYTFVANSDGHLTLIYTG